MVFTSHIFIFYFLPIFLLIYYNFPHRWRNGLITVGSYVFYGWWEPWFVCLMMFTTVMDFLWGRVVGRPEAPRWRRRAALLACVCTNLGFLGFFKYFMFSMESLNRLREAAGADALPILLVTLPIGISFYTFHSLTYVIDVYRGDARPAKSFADFACFVALFPDLVAGPIIRYHTLADQLASREHTGSRFASGTALFILGFGKKVLLANPCGHMADAAFGAAAPCALDAWAGVLAYAFQIYFDFCGYSDMAVGLGRMLGFEYLKNFDAPYRAESFTDFWRRWHISLSTVLRDYLYIPLGGNRKGPWRTYINLAVVMLLGGLWHGAAWNFLAWGACHGLLLGYERWRGKQSVYDRLPRPCRVALTFVLILFTWVLFRAADLPAAGRYCAAMLGLGAPGAASALLAADLYGPQHLLVMAACALLVFQPVQAHEWIRGPLTWRRVAFLVPLFAVSLLVMFSQAFNPFLYFQF